MKRLLLVSFIILAMLNAAAPAYAAPELEQAASSYHGDKLKFIAGELSLDSKQEKIFWPMYHNYQAELQKVTDKRIQLIKDFQASNETLKDEQASVFIRRALELEEQRLGLKKRYVAIFLGKFPARIVARYFQLENKIQVDIDAQIAEKMPLVSE